MARATLNCEILWNTLEPQEWQSLFKNIRQSNLLQSYEYARAYCAYAHQRAAFGLILINGEKAGLFQIFETRLFWGAIHTVILDRGPLWFDGYGGAAHVQAFFKTFNALFPARLGRKRRILPETEQSTTADKILQSCGLTKQDHQSPYQTYWLNLSLDTDALRSNLKQKWRNSLNKGERSPVEYQWDETGQTFQNFKIAYASHKAAKEYAGITPKLLDNLARFQTQTGTMIIGNAYLKGRCIASIYIALHGGSATYLAGWSDDEGRLHCAHHALLWQAIERLKEKNILDFDLGGINEDGAKGVTQFKEGLGGHYACLIGQYS